MSSMHGLAGPEMSRPTGPELPSGYPDPANASWVRTEDIEFDGLSIRMTVAPGERIVELWELEDGHPRQWFGHVFRVDAEPPNIRLNYAYERRFDRTDRIELAHLGAKFWKS